MGRFVEICRMNLKVNADKNEVTVVRGENGLEFKIRVDGARLEQVSEFKYLGCVLDISSTDETVSCRKEVDERKTPCAIRFVVNATALRLQCAVALCKMLFLPVLLYDSETMIWREMENV